MKLIKVMSFIAVSITAQLILRSEAYGSPACMAIFESAELDPLRDDVKRIMLIPRDVGYRSLSLELQPHWVTVDDGLFLEIYRPDIKDRSKTITLYRGIALNDISEFDPNYSPERYGGKTYFSERLDTAVGYGRMMASTLRKKIVVVVKVEVPAYQLFKGRGDGYYAVVRSEDISDISPYIVSATTLPAKSQTNEVQNWMPLQSLQNNRRSIWRRLFRHR